MNINVFGSGKSTIIAMPGSGDAVFTSDMKDFSEYLGDDVSLVVVSRPGYGLCEETDKEITTEYIVESTRTALKNAEIEAPYILMPHSMSGMYATYWENTYPEEISGVIFIDSINEATEEITDEQEEPSVFEKFLNKTGVIRTLSDLINGVNRTDYSALYTVNLTEYSKSFINESRNYNANMKTAWASIETNNIPKIYISTDFQTVDDAKEYLIALNGEADEESAKELFDEQQTYEQVEYRRKRSEYIEKIGNCNEVNISGSHFIYNHKPEECSEVIKDFIDGLDA